MFLPDRLLSRTAAPEDDGAEEPPIHADPRLPVHVTRDDARLFVEDGNPVVECGETRRALHIGEISLVALHGGATVTTPCMALLAEHGVPLLLLSRHGYYRGQLVDLSEQPTRTRRAHYRRRRIRLRRWPSPGPWSRRRFAAPGISFGAARARGTRLSAYCCASNAASGARAPATR